MEFILEFLFEIYLDIGEILIPDHKFKKWQETLLKLTSACISLTIVALIVAGICILNDDSQNIIGIILLSVGCAILLAQIILFIIVLAHQSKKEKHKNQASSNDENTK